MSPACLPCLRRASPGLSHGSSLIFPLATSSCRMVLVGSRRFFETFFCLFWRTRPPSIFGRNFPFDLPDLLRVSPLSTAVRFQWYFPYCSKRALPKLGAILFFPCRLSPLGGEQAAAFPAASRRRWAPLDRRDRTIVFAEIQDCAEIDPSDKENIISQPPTYALPR